MSFWESKLGAVLGVALIALTLVVVVAGVRVHFALHPAREPGEGIDFEGLLISVDRVEFPAADGIPLAGWSLPGDPGRPPVILCHDHGSSKVALLPLAIELHHRGYPVLLFDFRGHGASGGRGSTLGLNEKRDVLGALDYLTARGGSEPRQVGAYAVGMGAHAAVLAAADRAALRVLVLDRLYPDASYPLARSVFAGWEPGIHRLDFLSSGLFTVLSRERIGTQRAADAMRGLRDRHMLLLAPEDSPGLVAEMQRMIDAVPEHPDADGNLVVLSAAEAGSSAGGRHHSRVASFFDERLGTAGWATRGGGDLPASLPK
jgi:pimeloyl-ACP methyl ester carboxylesterase